MTEYPLPADLSFRDLGVEDFPEIEIFPPFPSSGHGVDHILAITPDDNFDSGRKSVQGFDSRGDLRPVVGGGRFGP